MYYGGNIIIQDNKGIIDKTKLVASVKTYSITASKPLTVTLLNSKGLAITGKTISIKAYGKVYKATTNSKGVASYQTKGLSKGTHKIVVSAKPASYTFKTFTSSIKVVKQSPLKFKVTRATGKDGATISIAVKNKKTNKAESLVLMGAGGLTDDEIRSAVADAEAAREADEARKAHLVAKNKVQSLDFSIARMKRENANDADEDLLKTSTELLERADALLAREDATTEDYEAMSAELSTCSCKWHEIVYEKERIQHEKEEAEQQAQQQTQQPNPEQ